MVNMDNIEPYRIKVVEPIHNISREEREEELKKADFNLFNIPADKIFVDLLTDSGTTAMSDNQWAGMMVGDESYAGSKSYFHFRDSAKSIFGYKHIIPAHQGRGAENVLFSILLTKGKVIPGNIHFDTTRANIEFFEGCAADLVQDCAYDPDFIHSFKGNIDLHKLDTLIQDVGREDIPMVILTITNNSGGGQPVSMQNIRQTKELLDRYGIPLYFDTARFAENCYFIKMREEGYKDKPIKEIANEIFSYGDGCIMSAKKDGLANIGGMLCTNDDSLAEKIKIQLILREGFPTYGGLAGRDLEVLARGFQEVLGLDYLHFRISQVKFISDMLLSEGIPIMQPPGGHAVYIDAKRFLSHIPSAEFPGQALAVALYREAGIRGVEIGSLMFASKNPETGEVVYPKLEMVRLAIPRRVYTNSHLKYVADTIIEIYNNRDKLKGLKITYEAPFLRHFTARLEEIE